MQLTEELEWAAPTKDKKKKNEIGGLSREVTASSCRRSRDEDPSSASCALGRPVSNSTVPPAILTSEMGSGIISSQLVETSTLGFPVQQTQVLTHVYSVSSFSSAFTPTVSSFKPQTQMDTFHCQNKGLQPTSNFHSSFFRAAGFNPKTLFHSTPFINSAAPNKFPTFTLKPLSRPTSTSRIKSWPF